MKQTKQNVEKQAAENTANGVQCVPVYNWYGSFKCFDTVYPCLCELDLVHQHLRSLNKITAVWCRKHTIDLAILHAKWEYACLLYWHQQTRRRTRFLREK
ncbi:hypothetical protein SAMN05421788_102150 [Filimonas lacunae]|uniref:Uncharacterized protein n=1 Tax=Filimonas lacunae TaxID=477680 RepID=A0A1N7N430_9BACT|nr:hypothetical protein [Filimonas lacunae]SIS92919.1 hypothetical protein SAMN05421788_102150 [Filimonas lacunae]